MPNCSESWPRVLRECASLKGGRTCQPCCAQGELAMCRTRARSNWCPSCPRTLGGAWGTELRESQYVLSAKNSAPVQRGMIFHVSLGAHPAIPILALQSGCLRAQIGCSRVGSSSKALPRRVGRCKSPFMCAPMISMHWSCAPPVVVIFAWSKAVFNLVPQRVVRCAVPA